MKLYKATNSALISADIYVIADSIEKAAALASQKFSEQCVRDEIASIILVASEDEVFIQ